MNVSVPVLQTQNLTRRFGKLLAVDALNLSVAGGERVALLGHNGAGKTTLFRLILGFIKPQEGSVSIEGHAPGSKAARESVAYLPENVAFPKNLTGREVLELLATLKGVKRSRCITMLEKVGLADAANRRIGGYSKGMRQRLGLAQALLGEPTLLLLDEPTSGLDPLSRQDFYSLADAAAKGGTAVLQSSHSLTELEARTDRIAILKHGRVVANAPLKQLQSSASLPVQIQVRTSESSIDTVSDRLGGTRLNGHSLVLSCQAKEKVDRLRAISGLGGLIEDVDLTPPSLDDVYRFYCSTDSTTEGM